MAGGAAGGKRQQTRPAAPSLPLTLTLAVAAIAICSCTPTAEAATASAHRQQFPQQLIIQKPSLSSLSTSSTSFTHFSRSSASSSRSRPVSDLSCPSRRTYTSCEESDAALLEYLGLVCVSLVGDNTTWCGPFPGVKASGDWPSQTNYMICLLDLLVNPSTCLNTTTARRTAEVLNGGMADPTEQGSYMWTFLVFQVQYYDMPRKAGERIETPWTLGLKSYAFAANAQHWQPQALQERLAASHLNMTRFIDAFNRAVPLTYTISERVMANCFKNASYDPSRNGTCPLDIVDFHAGFDKANGAHGLNARDEYYPKVLRD